MRIASLFVFATVLVANQAASAEPALFEAFRRFCIETEAEPAAVKVAALAAGGEELARAPLSAINPMGLESWNVTVQGHRMKISAGAVRAPANESMKATDSKSCLILDYDRDDAGVVEVEKWTGVPGSAFMGVSSVDLYYWRVDRNGKHVPGSPPQIAIANGQDVWVLVVTRGDKSSNSDLSYFRPLP